MTAVAAPLNPYLDAYLAAGGSAEPTWDWWMTHDMGLDRYTMRRMCVAKYAWAIPTPEAVAALVDLGPIVEVGAGSGYWAGQIAMAGGDVLAYDIRPPRDDAKRANEFGHSCQWHPVMYGGAPAAKRHPDRALLLCWPPYSTPMASKALAAYRGDVLAFIGEGEGGCTADDDFFTMVEKDWTSEREVLLPQWPGMHDYLTIYRRAA